MVAVRNSNVSIDFAPGRFDDWCVYLFNNGQRTVAPNDVDYFNYFQIIQQNHPFLNIYEIFVQIYDRTDKFLEEDVLLLIEQLVDECDLGDDDTKYLEGYLKVIYMAMIAEENKANTKLGKRIKRLGMHNLLIEHMTAREAANASRGLKWKDLDRQMQERGF